MSTHYVTRIVIEKIDVEEPPRTQSSQWTERKRHKTMLANIVVGAGQLEALKSKAAAHLQLVEDGGDIE